MLDLLPSAQEWIVGIVPALIGGAFVALLSWLNTIFKRIRTQAKYPLAGTYTSYFEDVVDGQRIVARATARIRQKGSRIEIVDSLTSNQRWTLEGSILPGGHISGVYSADADYDDGVGCFTFERAATGSRGSGAVMITQTR